MTVIILGNNERILYYNVTQIIDESDKLILLGDDERELQIVINYNCHTIGEAPMVTIEKSNLLCNEIYIDDDFHPEVKRREAKYKQNAAYGSMVYADTDSRKEDPENE